MSSSGHSLLIFSVFWVLRKTRYSRKEFRFFSIFFSLYR
nr:MAG TPA: hypothetical protein [Caudoviricetes sp.]